MRFTFRFAPASSAFHSSVTRRVRAAHVARPRTRLPRERVPARQKRSGHTLPRSPSALTGLPGF